MTNPPEIPKDNPSGSPPPPGTRGGKPDEKPAVAAPAESAISKVLKLVSDEPQITQLKIEPLIEKAERLHRSALKELSAHPGILNTLADLVSVTKRVKIFSQKQRRFFSLHRMPLYFGVLALIFVAYYVYATYVEIATITIARSARDTDDVERLFASQSDIGPDNVRTFEVAGTSEGIRMLVEGKAELAFAQGGIDVPPSCEVIGQLGTEYVLFLARGDPGSDFSKLQGSIRILTSYEDQGSHAVAKKFFQRYESVNVTFEHDWPDRIKAKDFNIEPSIYGIFVVKDLRDHEVREFLKELHKQGFRMRPTDFGILRNTEPWLGVETLTAGAIVPGIPIPEADLEISTVATNLISGPKITPAQHDLVAGLFDHSSVSSQNPLANNTWEFFQGLEALMMFIIELGIGVVALVGVEVLIFRKRFHQLSTLVSIIGTHQARKDVAVARDKGEIHEKIAYLEHCSDALGIIDSLAGFYVQCNPALVFDAGFQMLHQRIGSLKLNIQIKILQGVVNAGKGG
ncbi:MAG: hypothetical protein NUW37_19705 [Planctomycetes bacterium]|nr:hypothetical protein [Planctomycetota bacterium]